MEEWKSNGVALAESLGSIPRRAGILKAPGLPGLACENTLSWVGLCCIEEKQMQAF